jgi:hypothetical protein
MEAIVDLRFVLKHGKKILQCRRMMDPNWNDVRFCEGLEEGDLPRPLKKTVSEMGMEHDSEEYREYMATDAEVEERDYRQLENNLEGREIG